MYEMFYFAFRGPDMRFLIGRCEQPSADWNSTSLVRVVYSEWEGQGDTLLRSVAFWEMWRYVVFLPFLFLFPHRV